ncbi:AaceriABR159Cp [[Ashbya] aceris (nom. inval.)]|nr:AaceriABR159Cp [[Ashbya] aceris (nom. inval.)]
MHLQMILALLCLFGRFGRGLAPRVGGLVGRGGVADVGGEELTSSAIQSAEALAAQASHVTITRQSYDKLVYFSKICALTYCIKDRTLVENMTFYDGGCPVDIEFCSNLTVNPTAKRTRVELVLEAERNELGTGYVAVDHGRQVVILAFRGSSTQQDWFSDMQIHPIAYVPASLSCYNRLVEQGVIPPCIDCKVHRGFYRFAKTLSRNFLERIERIYNLYPNYKLVVTGHSLGAALASLCGIELALRGFEPLVLTYATPRMFNHSLRDWVNALFNTEQIHLESVQKKELQLSKGYFRVVHTRDYIPMVPPLYVAAGLEIYIEKLHFPHELEDLHYRGMNLEPLWHIEGDLLSPRSRFNERIEKWLHMYEHRSYFIMINTCSGF